MRITASETNPVIPTIILLQARRSGRRQEDADMTVSTASFSSDPRYYINDAHSVIFRGGGFILSLARIFGNV